MSEKAEFLGGVRLFKSLTPNDLEELAHIAVEYEYPAQSVVAYQRDVADCLYIVRTGRLESYTLDEQGDVVDEKVYEQRDYFEDVWLLHSMPHPGTVKALETSRVFIIEGNAFLDFLQDNPNVLTSMSPNYDDDSKQEVVSGFSRQAWRVVTQQHQEPKKRYASAGLLEDEIVVFESRRTRWLLVMKIAFPLFIAVFVPMIMGLLTFPNGGMEQVNWWMWGGILAVSGIALLFVLFQTIDWWNDYFLVTNKRIIHNEFSLSTFHATVAEAPIQQVQSVKRLKPTLLANLFDVGTVKITTAAARKVITFDFIGEPELVELAINDLSKRVRGLDAGKIQATMRRSIERHFNIPSEYRTVEGKESATAVAQKQNTSFLFRLNRAFSYRTVERGTITYRKHFFMLLFQILVPLLVLISLIVAMWLFWEQSEIVLLLVVVSIIDLFALIWQVEDWRNDTYQITERFVIDIDRRPFGFGESRKQAELSNIQNATSDKAGVFAVLFDYGNVIVDTAGSTSDIVFESVAYPNRVKSDIFQKMEEYRQQQRTLMAQERQREYGVLLDVYQQAMEQKRIPNRTPPRSS